MASLYTSARALTPRVQKSGMASRFFATVMAMFCGISGLASSGYLLTAAIALALPQRRAACRIQRRRLFRAWLFIAGLVHNFIASRQVLAGVGSLRISNQSR